jgi:hypothetical protein
MAEAVQRSMRDFEPLELSDLIDFQPDLLFLPSIEGLFRNAHSPDRLRKWHSGFGLL